MSKGGLGATKLTEVSKTPKIDNETPAQKQAAAKLALRKQLEKTLLQVRNLSFKIILVVPKYQNCSDLLWEKIVLEIEKNFWNSRLKAENLKKNSYSRSEQLW